MNCSTVAPGARTGTFPSTYSQYEERASKRSFTFFVSAHPRPQADVPEIPLTCSDRVSEDVIVHPSPPGPGGVRWSHGLSFCAAGIRGDKQSRRRCAGMSLTPYLARAAWMKRDVYGYEPFVWYV
jgi:hypothetical protein